MIVSRRGLLVGGGASLVAAPSLARASSLMSLRGRSMFSVLIELSAEQVLLPYNDTYNTFKILTELDLRPLQMSLGKGRRMWQTARLGSNCIYVARRAYIDFDSRDLYGRKSRRLICEAATLMPDATTLGFKVVESGGCYGIGARYYSWQTGLDSPCPEARQR